MKAAAAAEEAAAANNASNPVSDNDTEANPAPVLIHCFTHC